MASLLRSALSWLHVRIGAVPVERAAREFGEIPPSEQRQVWDDLAGTDARGRVFNPSSGKELLPFSEEHEPSAMVEDALQKLDQELHKKSGDMSIASPRQEGFMKALELSPEYVKDRNFRLKFSRAEKFDVKAAAVRMRRHFEEKLKLFGEEALGREILLSDLVENDMDAMNRGYLQVFPERDSNNRKVIFYYKAISDCYKERENILRSFWYVANAISLDEDVQKLGVVNVVYNIGGFPENGMDYEKSRRLSLLFRAIPIRFNGFYVCLDESAWITVVETFSTMISLFLRLRLRMITGTHQDVQHKLKELGIPSGKALPVDDSSRLLLKAHSEWIEQRTEIEKKQKEKENPPHLHSEVTYDNLLLQQDIISDLMKSTSSHYGSVAVGASSNTSGNEIGSLHYKAQASGDNIREHSGNADSSAVGGKRKAAHQQHSSPTEEESKPNKTKNRHTESVLTDENNPSEDNANTNRKKSREHASAAEDDARSSIKLSNHKPGDVDTSISEVPSKQSGVSPEALVSSKHYASVG